MVGEEGHLGAIKALLIKNHVLKGDGSLQIIMKVGVMVTGIVLWLRHMAAYCLNPSPPTLFGYIKHLIRRLNTLLRLTRGRSRTHCLNRPMA